MRFFDKMKVELESLPSLLQTALPFPLLSAPQAHLCGHSSVSSALGCAHKKGSEENGVSVDSALYPPGRAAHNLKPQSLPHSVAFLLWAPVIAPSFVPSCRVGEKVSTACSFRVLHHFLSFSTPYPQRYNSLFIKLSLISRLDYAMCFLLGP